MHTPQLAFDTGNGAVLSGCETYRYRLWRTWNPDRPRMIWIMLNPSTADANADDPTIRRCIGFARRFDLGGIAVLNLFALRATDPRDLLAHPDPVGTLNRMVIPAEVEGEKRKGHPVVVAGWGAVHPRLRHQIPIVRAWVESAGVALRCVGTTKGGDPRHPLYVRGDAPLVHWPAATPEDT